MIWLLLASALAQEPQEFTPVPVDVEVSGEVLQGILVDEATYTELGELRVLKREQEIKLEAHQDFETWAKEHLDTSLTAVRDECATGQAKLVDHYESALKKEKRKDWFQRQGFPLGIAIGVVGTTALTIGVLHVYDNTLPNSLTGN